MAHDTSAPAVHTTLDARAAGAPSQQFISVGAAARRLGLHRSTLNLAIRRGLIVPDLITAGGHARFSDITLDTYAERLRHAPATSASPADASASSSLVEKLEWTLAEPSGAKQALERSLRDLQESFPGFIRFSVIERVPTESAAAPPISVAAQLGHTPELLQRFLEMYQRVPFATQRVLGSGEALYVEDTARQVVRESGTALLGRQAGHRAFASLPLALGNRIVGALGLASPEPFAFAGRIKDFLQETAQEAALLVGYHQRMERQREWTSAVGAFAQARLGLAGAGRDGAAPTPASAPGAITPLERLALAFVRAHDAEEVCVLGAGADIPPHSQALCALMQRLDPDHPRLRAEWSDARGDLHGIALLAPGGAMVAAGALWRAEAALRIEEGEAALLTMLGICALSAR